MKILYGFLFAALGVSGAMAQTVVSEQTIDVNLNYGDYYEGLEVEFDADAVIEAIGVAPGDAQIVTLIGEEFSSNLTGNNGFWYNIDGEVCPWGEQAAVYAEYWDNNIFGFGQMDPGMRGDSLPLGTEINANIGFCNDDKVILFNLHYTIVEHVAVDYEIVWSDDVTVDMTPWTEWVEPTTVEVDMAAASEAIDGLGKVKLVAQNPDGEIVDRYTANVGYWYDAEGNVVAWGTDQVVYIEYYEFEPTLLSVGQLPEALKVGDTVKVKFGFANNTKVAMFNVTINITDGTGVEAIANDGIKTVYNMQGMRVNSENLPAGLYIINGKKVAVK